jgi:hypothetical protein
MLGVPALVLQGTRGLDFRLRGDNWALFRYLQAFRAVARVHPKSPALPIWYVPDTPGSEAAAEKLVFDHIEAIFAGNKMLIQQHRAAVSAQMDDVLQNPELTPPFVASIEVQPKTVTVHVGAKPDKKSWHEKGSGQMDPYVGLILAAKYIYCFNAAGRKTKSLILSFTHLPKGFWWFSNPATTALYKRLPIEFADKVRFLG